MDELNENDTFDTTNPFYQLLEKQQQQNSNYEVTTDSIEKDDSSTNDSQLKLMDSLKARIEELETDSIIRNQEIQQLKQELNKFKNISESKELDKMKKDITDSIKKDYSSTNDSQLKLMDARIGELKTDSIIRNQYIEKQKSEIQQLKQELNKFKNISGLKELEKMKKKIDELNDFKKIFLLKTKEAESKSRHIDSFVKDIDAMRLFKTIEDNSVDAQCGAKLAVGETYYHCRTCAKRNNSVLCKRCYKGTNHSGHDVLTIVSHNASNWCDCGDPDYWKVRLNCKHHSSNIQSSECGTTFAIGETYYRCRTCAKRDDSILCRRCFVGTNHSGHDVSKVVNRNASNWCDCGDPDYWKVHLRCKFHSSNVHSQCGAKLAVGETYYSCWTCAKRNNSVLCRRCYEGTNHSGHNVVKRVNHDASNWCDCGDPDYWEVHFNCKYHPSNVSHTDATRPFQCGAKLAVGEVFYQCRTCSKRSNSILCRRCYNGTNHNGHDVLTIVNHDASNWCDCGDTYYWKVHLNCKYHSIL